MQVLRQVIIGGLALALTVAGVVASHASAVEPLPTAGSEQTAVVHALITLAQGDPDALVALPGHLIDEAPAVVDRVDAALARRWTTLLPAAIARLPPGRQTAVLTALDVRFAQAGPGALPWDYLPAPAATRAVAKAAAQAFDHGNFRAALAWEPSGDRAAAALSLLHGVLPLPALPQRGEGLLSSAMAPRVTLVAGDGWLFGLDPVGRVQWQRRCERQAQIIVGEDAALLVETAGAAVIAADGTARRLPPLPGFAKPWGVTAACAWFVAGTTAWRVTLSVPLAATTVDLIEPPLGPPVMQGDRAWWLTRTHLLTTESARIVDRLPHLLQLSSNAILGRHPHGALIRDHLSWWLVGSRTAAATLDQAESWLLAGDAVTAKGFLDESPRGRDLAFRCAVATAAPDAVLRAAAETPQHLAIAWLVGQRRGATPDVTVLDRLVTINAGLLLTEPTTNLALPPAQWPLRTTLAAWRAPADGAAPQITITSDAVRVVVRATWSADRWWERCWPTRPLLDAPSRSWAAVDGAVIIADGADQLLVLDQRTGELLVSGDVTGDIDPAAVIRVGLTGAAVLIDQGRTLQVLTRSGGQRIALTPPGINIRADSPHTVEVQHSDGSAQRITLTVSPGPAAGSPAGASGAP